MPQEHSPSDPPYQAGGSRLSGRNDCDLTSVDQLRAAILRLRPTLVFHLAALPDRGRTAGDTTDDDTVRIAENLSSLLAPSVRIVVLGSAKQYRWSRLKWHEDDRPPLTSAYGVAKRTAEDIILQRHPKTTAVRMGPVYGGRQPGTALIPKAVRHFSDTDSSFSVARALWAPLELRDCLDVLTLVAASDVTRGEIINIGGAKAYTVVEIVQRIARLRGRDPELVQEQAGETPADRQGLLMCTEKAIRLLGWSPRIDLKQGLRDYLAATDRPCYSGTVIAKPGRD